MPAPGSIDALRSLLAARFPSTQRKPAGLVPTGIRPIDEALGGGLAAGRVTEIVSAVPSSGGQLILGQLLGVTRSTRQRLALIDGADGFAPHAIPADCLRHLVWVRCHELSQALSAADILVRDGNYGIILLDLRGCDERELRRIPATLWHRLHRAAETGAAAILVQSTHPLVQAAPWRLVLQELRHIDAQNAPRTELLESLNVEVARGRFDANQEMSA